MKNYIFWALLFLLSLNSCSHTPYHTGTIKEVSTFELETEIAGHLLSIHCPGAFTISAYDTLLLVSTDHRPTAWLDIFSLNTDKSLGTFCTVGQGSNEFMAFHHYGQYFLDSKGDLLLPTIDYVRKYAILNLTKTVAEQRTCFEQVFPWREEYFHTSGLFTLSPDSTLIQYPCYKTDSRDYNYYLPRSVLYVDNQEVKAYDIYARKVETPQFSQICTFVYDAISSLKPDKTKWVEGLRGADYLNIIDLKSGHTLGVKNQGTLPLEQIGDISFEQMRFYYMSVTSTDDLILTLYINQPVIQFQTAPQPGEIRIFDWAGNPKACIKIKENLSWIAFADKQGVLYGLDHEEHIYEYNLNPILQSLTIHKHE